MFPVTPDALGRIEFRRIAGQRFDHQSATLGADEVANHPRPVRGEPVPYHQQLAREMAQQMAEEVDDVRAPDCTRVEPEVEVPPGDGGDRRQHLPVEMMMQHRRLPARRPGAHSVGSLAQPALIDEDDGALFPERFFLICGQRYFCHFPIAASSRSKARPTGRWQLQPSSCRMRQTWSSWYRTPVRYSMRSRTRRAVHSPLAKPNASGPRLSACSMSRNWAALSLAGRPVRLARRRPRIPDCLSLWAQRLTDCRCTPTWCATADWLSLCRSNRAAASRRPSRAAKSRRTPAGFPMRYILASSRILSLSFTGLNNDLELL